MRRNLLDSLGRPPSFKEHRTSFPWVWIVIGVLLISLGVYFLVNTSKQVISPSQNIQETAQPEQIASADSGSQAAPPVETVKSAAPEFSSKCDVVAGIVSGSVQMSPSQIVVTFKNNGKKTIEGSYFEFSAGDSKAYRKNSDSLAPGETVTYNVDLDDAANELGLQVKSFIVLPIQDGKACMNQRMVVINLDKY